MGCSPLKGARVQGSFSSRLYQRKGNASPFERELLSAQEFSPTSDYGPEGYGHCPWPHWTDCLLFSPPFQPNQYHQQGGSFVPPKSRHTFARPLFNNSSITRLRYHEYNFFFSSRRSLHQAFSRGAHRQGEDTDAKVEIPISGVALEGLLANIFSFSFFKIRANK